jgi:hypothetical protein
VTVLQVRGDGGRAGLVPAPVELPAQRDDLVLDLTGVNDVLNSDTAGGTPSQVTRGRLLDQQ